MLDYGTVGARENRTITFKIINKNPVEVGVWQFQIFDILENLVVSFVAILA